MHLSSVTLRNFRCYEEVTFNFQPNLTLITGGNDAGKSALLEGIQALYTGKGVDVDDLRHCEEGTECPTTVTVEGAVLDLSTGTETRFRRHWGKEGSVMVGGALERMEAVPVDPELREAKAGWGRAPWVKARQQELLRGRGVEPANTAEELKAQFAHLLDREPSEEGWAEVPARPGIGMDVEYHSHEDAGGDPVGDVEKHLRGHLSAMFKNEADRAGMSHVKRRLATEATRGLREIARIFARYDGQDADGQAIQPEIDIDVAKGFRLNDVSFRQHGMYRKMSKMGAAKRRKLQLALLEWRKQATGRVDGALPLLLLYDEPDTHFDYAGQRRMFNLLRGMAEQDGVQVVVVTHSLNMIDRVELFQIGYLDQTAQTGVPATLVHQPQEWMEIVEVAQALGLRNHVVLNACLLLMEGPTEHALLPGLFDFAMGYPLRSIGVEVLEGATGNGHAWNLTKHALRGQRRAFLVLDRDTASGGVVTPGAIQGFNRDVGREAIQQGANLFYLGEVELEDLFTPKVLAEALARHVRETCAAQDVRPPARAALRRAVEAAYVARERYNRRAAYTKALERALADELKENHRVTVSKPAVGAHLLSICMETQGRAVPKPVRVAFERLEAYAEG